MGRDKIKSATSNGVILSKLLSSIIELLRTYLVISEAQCVVIALWVVHTYFFEAFDRTPYLHISSVEKRCGKTLLLDILKLLVHKPWSTSNATTAALARKIATDKPTVLIDEADAFVRGSSERAEMLRGILNAGYQKGGSCSRVASAGHVIELDVFCPKAIAGLQSLPDTIADRSIPIKMKRATAEERPCWFDRHDAERIAANLRNQLETFASAYVPAFSHPDRIEELNYRQNDIVEPLLAIANLAGGEWPEKVRRALLELFEPNAGDYQNDGTQLLSDIRDIFDEAGVSKMRTKELIRDLCSCEESPWSEYRNGKPINAYALARILNRYDIHTDVWREGMPVRGYQRTDFEDAWNRYLPQHVDAATAFP